jgi:hypothetical protein
MKMRDYAHLGAAARLEQLKQEIARIYKEFPALKHTTPLGITSKQKRSKAAAQRRTVSRRAKARSKKRPGASTK